MRKVLAGNGIDRNVMLEQLRAKADRPEAVDLVVVGGGITGAGVALDAALRGFDVVLVERGDFASGTSSKSSKLVHGGLRYLQQGDVALVREALREQKHLAANCAGSSGGSSVSSTDFHERWIVSTSHCKSVRECAVGLRHRRRLAHWAFTSKVEEVGSGEDGAFTEQRPNRWRVSLLRRTCR